METQWTKSVDDLPDKRWHPRYTVSATACVLQGGVPGIFQVTNLSVGGALLQGDRSFRRGTDLLILLHAPWHQLTALDVVVAHNHTAGQKLGLFGVSFRQHFSASIRHRYLQSTMLRKKMRTLPRDPVMLVAAERPALGQRLAHDLGLLGIEGQVTKTPLDLFRKLLDPGLMVHQIFIDLQNERSKAISLCQALTSEFPETQHVLIGDPNVPRLNRIAASYAQVKGILEAPYTLEQLARSVG